MNQKWMLFYKEVDKSYFFFTGEWPIAVYPNGPAWNTDARDTAKDLPMLQEILNSKKRVFTHNKARYIIETRGVFLSE